MVFSDYGRDRLAFQSYESILDPSLPAKSLPMGNQSVRKMQAAMCLIDWIAVRLVPMGHNAGPHAGFSPGPTGGAPNRFRRAYACWARSSTATQPSTT